MAFIKKHPILTYAGVLAVAVVAWIVWTSLPSNITVSGQITLISPEKVGVESCAGDSFDVEIEQFNKQSDIALQDGTYLEGENETSCTWDFSVKVPEASSYTITAPGTDLKHFFETDPLKEASGDDDHISVIVIWEP